MRKTFCSVLLIISLLLTGCAAVPNETEPTEPTKDTQPPTTTETSQATEPAPTTEATQPTESAEDEELPDPFPDQAELVGTWTLAWTEVEGDRNEVDPGVCTLEITGDDAGSFRITYSDRDFPDWNFTDRELVLSLGELYPGCGNDRWIGEVSVEGGDTSQYALTLLEDGTLLLQTYWEMDGMPMVSYGWYSRMP